MSGRRQAERHQASNLAVRGFDSHRPFQPLRSIQELSAYATWPTACAHSEDSSDAVWRILATMSRELLCQYSSLLEGNWLEYFVGLALRITLRRLVRLLGLAIHIKRARDDLYVRASDEWRAGPSSGLRDVPGKSKSARRACSSYRPPVRAHEASQYIRSKDECHDENRITRIPSTATAIHL